MGKFVVIVLDGFGVGEMADVPQVRPADRGANTCVHIFEQTPGLALLNLASLGLANMVDTASVLQRTLELVQQQETAFICTNVQETDLCGHRENVSAYADRLRVADAWIGKIRDALGEDDILVVQADHGNDPTIGHPHHTREMVPLMIWSRRSTPKCIGTRKTLSDTGATAAEYFGMPPPRTVPAS